MKIFDQNTQNIHNKNQIQMVTHISDAQIIQKSNFLKNPVIFPGYHGNQKPMMISYELRFFHRMYLSQKRLTELKKIVVHHHLLDSFHYTHCSIVVFVPPTSL